MWETMVDVDSRIAPRPEDDAEAASDEADPAESPRRRTAA
jgi:hypothetical protein